MGCFSSSATVTVQGVGLAVVPVLRDGITTVPVVLFSDPETSPLQSTEQR